MHSPDLSSKIDAADSQGITPPHRRNVSVNPLATPTSSTTLSDIQALLTKHVHRYGLHSDDSHDHAPCFCELKPALAQFITSENTKRAIAELSNMAEDDGEIILCYFERDGDCKNDVTLDERIATLSKQLGTDHE